jgi:hypothetical protein
MSNQEEHKTWRMLKRAAKPEPFSTNIFPKMNANTFTDKLGTWVCSTDAGEDQANVWKLFDRVTSQYSGGAWGPNRPKYPTWFYGQVDFPKGIAICPYVITIMYASAGGMKFHGRKPNGEWVELITGGGCDAYGKTVKYNNPDNKQYYTAFRLYSRQPNSSNSVNYQQEITCTSGLIKRI